MKTVVIKVSELKDDQFPVELYMDDGTESWDSIPQAESFIPKDLLLKTPVEDPYKQGVPLSAAKTKEYFAAGYESSFKAIGNYLNQLLLQGDVRTKWEQLSKLYPGSQVSEGLRTILHVEPTTLRALPSELITSEDAHLFLKPANPFSRGKIPFNKNLEPHSWPLRALIIVGSKQKDSIDADLEVESIVGPLREFSRTIEVDIMRRRSKSAVVKQYENFQPHIIHFIGHGGLDSNNKPCLRLYDKEDNPQNWTLDDIANLANTEWTASFAFINACRTEDGIGMEESRGVAEAFVAARIPAVLSMAGAIKEEAAQILAASVYEALAQSKPLDQALARARLEVSLSKNKNQWTLASLFLSVPPEKVLGIDYKIEEKERLKIKDDIELGKLKAFVDRLDLRLDLSRSVDPRTGNGTNKSLFIVRGQSDVGKTWMVKLCLECSAMRGRKLSYVDAGSNQAKQRNSHHSPHESEPDSTTFLDVLRVIRDGDSSLNSPLLSSSLDEQGAFSQFNWELEQLLKPKKSRQTIPPTPHHKERSTGNTRKWKGNPQDLAPLFYRFREGLQKAAGNVPLIIVLDNIEIAPSHFNNVLIPHLILPITKGDVHNVKLILVLSQTNERDYKEGLAKLGEYERIGIVVSNFEKCDFIPLALEFLRYNQVKTSRDEIIGIVNALDKTIKEPWKPNYLNKVLAVLPR